MFRHPISLSTSNDKSIPSERPRHEETLTICGSLSGVRASIPKSNDPQESSERIDF